MFRAFVYAVPIIIFAALAANADDSFSVSGRLNLRGGHALDDESVKEDPSLYGRIKLEASASSWRVHSWLEGGWDGAVRRPSRDHSLFKSFDEVYQDNTPYLEFKELYLEHSGDILDLKLGIQRFAWGRLDEYPANDLLNPWDYTQFLRKPLEDRKIGVPSLSASVNSSDWTYHSVFVPWLVPYRLSMPDERWSGISTRPIPNVEYAPQEPNLPSRSIENSNVGFRALRTGEIEFAVNLFHGYDPRPVFRSTSFVVEPIGDKILIDPGSVPDFHRITSFGMDTAFVKGDWSFRAEAAYAFNRYFNVKRELWGYPSVPAPGARLHAALHGPTKGHAFFQLRGHILAHQLRIQLRFLDLFHVDVDLPRILFFKRRLELVHFRPFSADDDPRTGRMDDHAGLIARPLNLHLRDSCVVQTLLDHLANLDVLVQQLGVVLTGIPPRAPRIVVSQPIPDRMCLLTHAVPPSLKAGTMLFPAIIVVYYFFP